MPSSNDNHLSDSNGIRHAVFIKSLLSTALPGIKFGRRLGTRRSKDGIVFHIGRGKVMKIMFPGWGTTTKDTIQNEFDIAQKMGDAGLGPKVYDMFDFDVPNMLNVKNRMNWPSSNESIRAMLKRYDTPSNKMNKAVSEIRQNNPRSVDFNLFQEWFLMENAGYNRIKTGSAIVMDYLKNAVSLDTYAKKTLNPFPHKELVALVRKMHNAGIAHGDLHMGNVMVLPNSRGSSGIRLFVIDFGRSVDISQQNAFMHAQNSNLKSVRNVAHGSSTGLSRRSSSSLRSNDQRPTPRTRSNNQRLTPRTRS